MRLQGHSDDETDAWHRVVDRQCSSAETYMVQYYLLTFSNGYEEKREASPIIHMPAVCCDILRSSLLTNSKHSPPQIAPSAKSESPRRRGPRQLQYRHLSSLRLPCRGTLRLISTATFRNSLVPTSEVPRDQPAAGIGWGGSDNVTLFIGGMASISSA